MHLFACKLEGPETLHLKWVKVLNVLYVMQLILFWGEMRGQDKLGDAAATMGLVLSYIKGSSETFRQ